MRGSGAERRWNSHEKEKTHTGSTQRPRARSAGVAESLIGVRAKNGQAWDGVGAFSRDLQRPNVYGLLHGCVGDALVGQCHHTEKDHQ